jgi:hypothetical protein
VGSVSARVVTEGRLARPKSRTLTTPDGVILMFAGLRSRWTMPRSCAASSASAIRLAIVSASATGSGLRDALGQRVAVDKFEDECGIPSIDSSP